ncbi:hypothetical protein [Mycoplasma suis]|uniref:Uncharacterized protein n=1 Tax=Mycoplasma suis (strain KI_3806) TaxID=708248 RepID=F0V1V8_MYCS3|nr:hypothetical protein [Mycoplasma suis]CBZ40639.1 hypothetical protein MSUIS_05460 [Mycoplasma suis KI3806]
MTFLSKFIIGVLGISSSSAVIAGSYLTGINPFRISKTQENPKNQNNNGSSDSANNHDGFYETLMSIGL